MLETSDPASKAAVEALAECLEAMAFVSLFPTDILPDHVNDAVLVRIDFTGNRSGTLELLVSRDLGRLIVDGIASHGSCSAAQAEDAIKEIANMVCGRTLRSIEGNYDLKLPSAVPILTDEQWATFTTADDTVVLDAEGLPIALRLTVKSE